MPVSCDVYLYLDGVIVPSRCVSDRQAISYLTAYCTSSFAVLLSQLDRGAKCKE